MTQRFDKTNEELRRVFFASERNGALINLVVQSLPVIGLTIVIGIAFLVAEIAASVILVFLLIVSRLSPRPWRQTRNDQQEHKNNGRRDLRDQKCDSDHDR